LGVFPIVLNNQKFLIVGGSNVALRKSKVLIESQIEFEVISSEFLSEFDELNIKKSQKYLSRDDLNGFNVVVDCTGDLSVRELLLDERKKRFMLINFASEPNMSDFYFSSLINRDRLKVAVSTSGASPKASQIIRDKIENFLPKDLDSILKSIELERDINIIDLPKIKEQIESSFAKVYLIGCGLGDPKLLTIKAYELLQSVDTILYDHLITDDILALVPSTTKKIYVGKQKGKHSLKQNEINALIYEEAKFGAKVARLKSGDSYIFGRGSEEAIYLIERGIAVEVVYGISSAFSAPASAGIPPTARGYATNFSIVSAHLANNKINVDWIPLLNMNNHTTIVLMGLSFAKEIREIALKLSVKKDLKVAIISNASRDNQSLIVTTLDELERDSHLAEKPAVLVFGEVVSLSSILPKYTRD
jgi:uroporphyrin-III C-methyltransferase/precorrin-2 dehydrogenase/sirohydrochlorin ferrochelatase